MTWAIPGCWAAALLILAAYRIWRLLAHDLILDPIRQRLVKPESYLSDFIECPYCFGFWIALGWWLAWLAWPHWTLVVAVPLALSAVVALIAVNLGPD